MQNLTPEQIVGILLAAAFILVWAGMLIALARRFKARGACEGNERGTRSEYPNELATRCLSGDYEAYPSTETQPRAQSGRFIPKLPATEIIAYRRLGWSHQAIGVP